MSDTAFILSFVGVMVFSLYAGWKIGAALRQRNTKKVVVLSAIWACVYVGWEIWYWTF